MRLPLSECSPLVGSFPLELSPPSRSSFKPRPGSTLSGFGSASHDRAGCLELWDHSGRLAVGA